MKDNHLADYDYDVALSFAGEDSEYVSSVARCLKERGIKVFYDKYEQVELWGKDLYTHLYDTYKKRARYCVIFISKNYKEKLWTNHERESAQTRAFMENREYILPARFDDTEIPGIKPTIGYISLKEYTPSEFADLVCKKIGLSLPRKFLPSDPVKLFELLGAGTDEEKEDIWSIARHLLRELSLMTDDELKFIYKLFVDGCPTALPDNIHITLLHFERLTNLTKKQIEKIAVNLEVFGFSISIIGDKSPSWSGRERIGIHQHLQMEVHDRRVDAPKDNNITDVLAAMIDVLRKNFCEECGEKAFLRLDFSLLGKK